MGPLERGSRRRHERRLWSLPLSLALLAGVLGAAGCGAVPKIVILQDPLSAEEHLKLGLSYEAKGEWDLAISEYQAALKKGGTPSVIQGYLGNAYYAKKDFPSAKRAYRRSLQENPKNAPILNNLANLYLIESQEAQRSIERPEAERPIERQEAERPIDESDLLEAEALVRRAIEIDPDRKVYYLDTLGEIYMERGEYDLAWSVYREAEGLAPSDPSLLDELHANQKRLLGLMEKKNGPGHEP